MEVRKGCIPRGLKICTVIVGEDHVNSIEFIQVGFKICAFIGNGRCRKKKASRKGYGRKISHDILPPKSMQYEQNGLECNLAYGQVNLLYAITTYGILGGLAGVVFLLGPVEVRLRRRLSP